MAAGPVALDAPEILDFALDETPIDSAADSAVVDSPSSDSATDDSAVVTDDTVVVDDKAASSSDPNAAEIAKKLADKSKPAGDAKVDEEAAKEFDGTSPSMSKVLTALKAQNPTVAKELRDAFFGHQAFKKEFETVGAAREAKVFMEMVGGGDFTKANESWEAQKQTIADIEASDAQVINADPQILENVYEDLKAAGKEENFYKLGGHFLDNMKAKNSQQYAEVLKPHLAAEMEVSGWGKDVEILRSWIPELAKFYNNPDNKAVLDANPELAKAFYNIGLLSNAQSSRWTKLSDEVKQKGETAKTSTPEMEALKKERAAFEQEKTTRSQEETKAFQTTVATEADRYSNTALGKELASYLKMPFFKGMPQDDGKGGHAKWKTDLGVGIKQALYKALEDDNAYQAYMKQAWAAKKPDAARIKSFHSTKLDAIAADVVREVVERRYPGYAKGGSAAGRVAAQTAKTEKSDKAATASVQSGKPIYVAVKPKDLVRQPIRVAGKDYSTGDLTTLEIAGKGFVKSIAGKVKLVTWRK